MPLLFFRKRRNPAKDSSETHENAIAGHNATYSQKVVSKRIYAQNSRRTVLHEFGDLSKSDMIHICATTEPAIVPLQPSRRRNVAVITRNQNEMSEEKARGIEDIETAGEQDRA